MKIDLYVAILYIVSIYSIYIATYIGKMKAHIYIYSTTHTIT